ncbi:MAG: UvrD-helicase domain-containing protein [Polyangiales bacterium]
MNNAPTLVSAGAGSGKTYWIIEHLAARVLAGTPIERIAAVTFTEAAAAELQARLRARLLRAGAREQASRIEAAAVCTIHRFSLELLRRYPTAVGLPPDPLVLDERSSTRLREDAMESALSSMPAAQLDAVLDALGPGLGLSERGRSDADSPAGRLRSSIRTVLDKSRSAAMSAARLRDEANLAAARLIDAMPSPSRGALAVDEAFHSAVREALAFVRAKPEPPTQKDRPLYAILASVDEASFDTEISARLSLALTIAGSGSIDASKQFALGALVKKCADTFCMEHPALRERLAFAVRSVIELSAATLDAFDREKRRLGAVDFDDMQTFALALLEGRAPATMSYGALVASTLDLIVVDEFQDSAPMQFRIFEALRERGVEVAYVGDLKQAIYGFRAADSALFAALIDDASRDRAVHRLTTSRRSRPELVAFANDLFARLFSKTEIAFDPLESDNAYTQAPIEKREPCLEVVRHALIERGPMVGSKARAVAGRITALMASTTVLDRETGSMRAPRWSDVTVLARTHASLARWARDLRACGIPAALEHGPWFETLEAQLALAWLRMISSPRDTAASASVLVSELYGLSQRSVAALHARNVGGLPQRAVELHRADPSVLGLSERECAALERCAADLSQSREIFRTMPLVEAVEHALSRVELSLRLSLRSDEAAAAQVSANVRAFAEVAHELAMLDERSLAVREARGRTLEALLVELEQLRNDESLQPDAQLSRDAVSLTTLHASKGLEYPILVLDALGNQLEPRLPRIELRRPAREVLLSSVALDAMGLELVPEVGPAALWEKLSALFGAHEQLRDEQLRLLYVAFTRAREHLVLLWPEESKSPSSTRYVRDLLTDVVARPPSAAGVAAWVLGPSGASHPVLVSHATPRADAEESVEPVADEAPVRALSKIVDEAFERSAHTIKSSAESPLEEPFARDISPTELVAVHDCPEVVRLSVLHPEEHRIARLDEERVSVRSVRSARAERLALSGLPSASIGAWVHSAIEHARIGSTVDEDAVRRALASEPLGADREPCERYVLAAIASIHEAFAAMNVTEVVAQELPFVLDVGATLLRGTIDLLVRCPDGLRVMDVKTHPLDPASFARNAAFYRPQLDAYAIAAEALLREPVVGRDLLLPSAGAVVTVSAALDRAEFERSVRRWGGLLATDARGPGEGADCARCAWAPLCRVADEEA